MMNKDFEILYLNWYKATCFLSQGLFEVNEWKELVDWSKEHKDEAVEGIIEILSKEPDHVVHLCDELFPGTLESEGFIPLDVWCNMWLTILEAHRDGLSLNEVNIADYSDHYKEYNEYHKYLKDHYIPWNPFEEDDPNITLEEFKQGKRNPEK